MSGEILLGFSLRDFVVFGIGYIVGFSSKIAFKFGKYLIKRHKEKIKRTQAIMNNTIDYSKLSNDELKAIINGEFDK